MSITPVTTTSVRAFERAQRLGVAKRLAFGAAVVGATGAAAYGNQRLGTGDRAGWLKTGVLVGTAAVGGALALISHNRLGRWGGAAIASAGAAGLTVGLFREHGSHPERAGGVAAVAIDRPGRTRSVAEGDIASPSELQLASSIMELLESDGNGHRDVDRPRYTDSNTVMVMSGHPTSYLETAPDGRTRSVDLTRLIERLGGGSASDGSYDISKNDVTKAIMAYDIDRSGALDPVEVENFESDFMSATPYAKAGA